jgi:hypothetical protein
LGEQLFVSSLLGQSLCFGELCFGGLTLCDGDFIVGGVKVVIRSALSQCRTSRQRNRAEDD